MLIADFMIEHRGLDRGSYIAGPSTNNTRIERGWRDVRRHVTQPYIQFFNYLESDGLNTANSYHMWTLHYMFINRIQHELSNFVNTWNNHGLRTENSRTPKQLLFFGKDLVPPVEVNENEYGIENWDVDMLEVSNHMEVDIHQFPLSVLELDIFVNAVEPIQCDECWDDFYKRYHDAVTFLYSLR